MERLTGRNLRHAIEFATEHERTSIAILMDTRTSAVAMYRDILSEYRNLHGQADRIINFSNDSILRIYSVGDTRNVRGLRSNIVLLHNLVDFRDAYTNFDLVENHEHGHPGRLVYYDAETERYVEDIFAYEEPLRGRRANISAYEDMFVRNFSEDFDKWWETKGQFEFNNMVIEFRNKNAPDFGEFSPSQELNNYVNTLIQGK